MTGSPPANVPPPHQPPGGYGPPPEPAPQTGDDDRALLVLTHLAAPISWVLTAGFLGVLGPLIIWLIYRDSKPAVRATAANAFNFNLLSWLVFWVLIGVGIITLGIGLLVVIPLLVVLFVIAGVWHITGAVRASRGQTYRYPLQLPVLR